MPSNPSYTHSFSPESRRVGINRFTERKAVPKQLYSLRADRQIDPGGSDPAIGFQDRRISASLFLFAFLARTSWRTQSRCENQSNASFQLESFTHITRLIGPVR